MLISALIFATSSARFQAPELIKNPAFSQPMSDWGELYTREPGTGVLSVGEGHNGSKAVKIVTKTEQDWAFYQSGSVTVHPGDLFTIGAWVKTNSVSDANLSVVALDAKDGVLSWVYAPVSFSGTHDWMRMTKRFIVPPSCAAIRFRMVGNGSGTVWMSEPSMVNAGNLSSLAKPATQAVSVGNGDIAVKIHPDGSLSISKSGAQETWQVRHGDSGLVVTDLKKLTAAKAGLTLYDVAEDKRYPVEFVCQPHSSELDLSISGGGGLSKDLEYPGSLVTQKGEWAIVPMNEGIFYPVEDPAAPSLSLVTYGGHGICMPWFGVTSPVTGEGVTETYLTPDDSLLRLTRSSSGRLEPSPAWQPSLQQFGYTRKLRFDFFCSGGYVAEAEQYRRYAKAKGLLVTLNEKRDKVPAVDRLVGAVNVWSWDMDPVDLATRLKHLGMDRVLWSRGGSAEQMKALNSMGFLTSRYDIYQDVWDPKIALSWMNTVGWPEALVELPDGSWMKGWSHPDKQSDGTVKWIQGGVISSGYGLARAKQVIPEELKTIPYLCRFIDTTTASPWREDYNPLHRLTRSQDRENKMALLGFLSQDEHLVVGSETGLDASVPYLDYFEGMMSLGMYRLPDAGTDMMAYRKPTDEFLKYQVGSYYRLPLWELVYHDCTVSQWYWGDSTNKAPEVWDQRDLFNILYGTAPLLMFDKDRFEKESARMRQTYDNVCLSNRKTGFEPMISHQFLTPDHTVQETKFPSQRVIVNFGSKPYVTGGITVGPMSFRLEPLQKYRIIQIRHGSPLASDRH